MIAIIIDIILRYFGINSLIVFSYLVIKKNNCLDLILIGLIMDLLYEKYYVLYLIICLYIIKFIYKYFEYNIIINLIYLYIITFLYYIISIDYYNYKLIILYSFLPCIFYILFHIFKYENNKQNINRCNNYIMYFNRTKKKSKF